MIASIPNIIGWLAISFAKVSEFELNFLFLMMLLSSLFNGLGLLLTKTMVLEFFH